MLSAMQRAERDEEGALSQQRAQRVCPRLLRRCRLSARYVDDVDAPHGAARDAAMRCVLRRRESVAAHADDEVR